MRGAALVAHQLRFDQKRFWRNPPSVFFTLVMPVMFLVIFSAVFGDDSGTTRLPTGGRVTGDGYLVPGLIGLGIVSATFVNLAISTTFAREHGLLKRIRMTPLPPATFIAARVGTSILVAYVISGLLLAIGTVFYGVDVPPAEKLAGLALTIPVIGAAFCALGMALSAAIPSADAAPPMTNAIVLPMYFISGTFIPESELPDGLVSFASALPLRHLMISVFGPFDPTTTGLGIQWVHLAIVAAWGLAGLALAVRFFAWAPRAHT